MSDELVTTEYVDPDTARLWLGRNTRNRALKKEKIASYARDMSTGAWRFTGEPIKFGNDGSLLDGQNRLHAVIRAEQTILFLVIRGLDPDAQEVMDTGAPRRPYDSLVMRGEKSAAGLAAAAKIILDSPDDLMGSGRRNHTNSEVQALIDSDGSIRRVVVDILPGLKIGRLLSGTVAFYAYWRLDKIDPDAAHAFFVSLINLANLPEGSPIGALRNKLDSLNRSQRGRSAYAYRKDAVACIFTAWNAWRKGQTRKLIAPGYEPGGRLIIPDPV